MNSTRIVLQFFSKYYKYCYTLGTVEYVTQCNPDGLLKWRRCKVMQIKKVITYLDSLII